MTFRQLTIAAAFTLAVAAPAAAQSTAATNAQQDRADAARYLEETRAKFLKSIDGLTDAQWTFKPSPATWSIAEVAEHIAISESTILGLIEQKMLTAPAPKAGETMSDDKVITSLVDRTSKFQAPEMLRPVNKWATKDALVKDFNAARDKTIEFVKTTKEDLRAHATAHPALKMLDTHQWVLLIAGHSERHTLQIEEVKTAAGYPKN